MSNGCHGVYFLPPYPELLLLQVAPTTTTHTMHFPGIAGGWSEEAFNFMQNRVLVRESTVPYMGYQGSCPSAAIANTYKTPTDGYRLASTGPAYKTVMPKSGPELKKVRCDAPPPCAAIHTPSP